MSNPKINDSGGLWDNIGVCDKGIALCNAALKDLVSGQYLAFVNKVEQVAQIFANLKKGIQADVDSLNAKVEELKRTNDALVEQITGLPVLKEGKDNGNGSN